MQNELLNDLQVLQQTGDLPNNNNFLINQVKDLISKTSKEKYKRIKINPDKLTRDQLLTLVDDLKGYTNLPLYKLNQFI